MDVTKRKTEDSGEDTLIVELKRRRDQSPDSAHPFGAGLLLKSAPFVSTSICLPSIVYAFVKRKDHKAPGVKQEVGPPHKPVVWWRAHYTFR